MRRGKGEFEKTAAAGERKLSVELFCLVHAALFLVVVLLSPAYGQNKFEKHPINGIEIQLPGAEKDTAHIEEYRLIASVAVGRTYSTPRIRDAIEALYNTKRIETVTVLADLNPAGNVDLVFVIKLKTQVQKVEIDIAPFEGDKVTEEELLFKLNLLAPGTAITQQTLRSSADEILDYLRDRGFYKSAVTFETHPLPNRSEVGVTFHVSPNEQATVSNFSINIEGYNKPFDEKALKLRNGSLYSRDRLTADIAKVRDILRKDEFLAPQLDDPRVAYDSDTNSISIDLTGKVGPTIKIVVETDGKNDEGAVQNSLLPVKREGTLDFSAIVEGERRLENHYQEQGYFFANVTPTCSVRPQLSDSENNLISNETEFLCSYLGGEDLTGREVEIKYNVVRDRHLKLSDIRIRGTNKLTIEDVQSVLRTQEANALGIIPLFGYGRGYTSASILEDDAQTVRSLMRELGYRDAQVHVNQGVTPNGEDLIITFVIEEGLPTVVEDVTISGNQAIATNDLFAQMPGLIGLNFSRARMRNAARKISEYYSDQGYYDARVIPTVTDLGLDPTGEKQRVKIEFKVENEGKKVVINRILVNGNESAHTDAILKALTLKPGELLRSADIYTSEQNLYSSDVFSRVDIKPQFAGDGPDGSRLTDLMVSVEEQAPRLMTYGGGYSTEFGVSGFFDIRHSNLFGRLWQGGTHIRMSQRLQLVQFDFVDPRFLRDGKHHFAPLTLSLGYQRDTTVIRFFRSAFDQGTFGIVQRVDPDGNPIDEFGRHTGDPTINRAFFTAETSRTISRKNRSILFLRYRFEDVRLYNIESLLVKDLLEPDSHVRISGFSTTFARDTRRNCNIKYSLLDLIAKGEPAEPCRYNASDPTGGDYLTADYSVSLPAMGANIGFQKFQISYEYFYSFKALRNMTLASRAILGAGHVFSGGDRFNNATFPSLNGLLPISERFFAGGANNLRGFDFEEAGPRVVIEPVGIFRKSDGTPVVLDPFTVPFGGNALAVTNLELRIPLTKSLRGVPFYDGGNVFRRAQEIFNPPAVPPGDIERFNQKAVWTHTFGMGLRLKTPFGGELGVDYGWLLNPPEFLIPQGSGPPAVYRLQQGHIHFRFSQAF
jgi:outer membrane protein insertion porin family